MSYAKCTMYHFIFYHFQLLRFGRAGLASFNYHFGISKHKYKSKGKEATIYELSELSEAIKRGSNQYYPNYPKHKKGQSIILE